MKQCSNLNSLMESNTIQKNEVSLKSHKSRGNILKIFSILAVSVLLFFCNDDNGKNDDNSDSNSIEELYGEKGLELINEVSEQCENYIESYLQQYFSQNSNANITDLVNKINNIDEVKEASANDDNSVIRIQLKNGACFNHLILRAGDKRLMTEEIENVYQQFLNAENQLRNVSNTSSNYSTPNVKKALILVPFHTNEDPIIDFVFPTQDIKSLAMYLENAGYEVTTFKDREVTIDHLRGDYLKQFGVIYIHTHGGHSFKTLLGINTSMFFLVIKGVAIKKTDNEDLAYCRAEGSQCITVSERWISKNLDSLPNSLVYIDACWSGKLKSIFLNNGAGAFVGWNNRSVTFPPLTHRIANNVFNNLSKGKELDEVYYSSIWSSLESFALISFNDVDIDIGGYFHTKKVSNIPYYLIKKEEEEDSDWVLINGVKWATRNVGTPGTFVQNPEDYGEYYMYGSKDLLSWEDYYNSGYAKVNTWSPNDPSPDGYRVPSWDELASLLNTTYVTAQWTIQNGVYGGKFTDKSSGESIFLPAAGWRNLPDGSLENVGVQCYYWSSSHWWGEYYANALVYASIGGGACKTSTRNGAHNIRSVVSK